MSKPIKPTPQEIADFIIEDEYGLPVMDNHQQSGTMDDTYNVGPEFDQGGGPQEAAVEHHTEMRQCSASGCVYNRDGMCTLEAIEINEHGGCGQYEAIADNESSGDDSRYNEEESDIAGGAPATPQSQEQPGGNERHWQTNKWDPKGGGF